MDLALRAVAESEGFEISAEDLDNHFAELARRFGGEADELRHNFVHAGQMPAVRSDIKKAKALDWLLKRVAILDEDGNPVDRAALELSQDDPSPAPLAPGGPEDATTVETETETVNETDQPGQPGEDAS